VNSATAWTWFSTFLENPFVSRVNRRRSFDDAPARTGLRIESVALRTRVLLRTFPIDALRLYLLAGTGCEVALAGYDAAI